MDKGSHQQTSLLASIDLLDIGEGVGPGVDAANIHAAVTAFTALGNNSLTIPIIAQDVVAAKRACHNRGYFTLPLSSLNKE